MYAVLGYNALEDELGSDIAIDGTDNDGRNQNEGEGRLSLPRLEKRSDGRGSRVLAKVVVSDSCCNGEQDDLHDGQEGKSLREVARFLHLADKGGVQDLADPQEGDAADQHLYHCWLTYVIGLKALI